MEHKIIKTEEGSIAEEMGIEPGDMLISVNDTPIEDVFDFRMWEDSEELTLIGKSGNSRSRRMRTRNSVWCSRTI